MAWPMLAEAAMSEPTFPERLSTVKRELRGAHAMTARLQKIVLGMTVFPLALLLRAHAVPRDLVLVGAVAWIWFVLVLCKSLLFARRLEHEHHELLAELAGRAPDGRRAL